MSVNFVQSVSDFPLTVSLGEKIPEWGLSRCGGGLRFIPPDNEGFTLRGDKQRLLYKGRRRSHRFTIQSDTAFEYDCILEREPESNVIVLRMEGAERYDFLRQPSFLKNPLLAGSYAVYKKETLLGEGTGKLCHICRPEIIDSRGRRVWGEVSVRGSELRITIPEAFLSEAVYPVVVDPTVGTSTVGSQYLWEYDELDDEMAPLCLEVMIGVNRFMVSETISGTCTAYIYTNADDRDAGGRAVLYSDNNNIPLQRKSKNENKIDLRVTKAKPKGWRSGMFQTEGNITGGSAIWFGVFSEYIWYPRFDYGSKCYMDYWEEAIPDTYPLFDASSFHNFKLSMYFDYAAGAQNHTRTLTQGVSLVDNRKRTGSYRRLALQTVEGAAVLGRSAVFPRLSAMTVHSFMTVRGVPTFIRLLGDYIRAGMGLAAKRGLLRNCRENVGTNITAERSKGMYRKTQETVTGRDRAFFPALFLRSLPERICGFEKVRHRGVFVRGLLTKAANRAEAAVCNAVYYRTNKENVKTAAGVFRGLLMFVKIFTTSRVRDYVIRRFLKSKEEVVLKSAVCREIILTSRL